MSSTGISERRLLCRLTEVEKAYGRKADPVLGPISLEVESGGILGIRGANGAGKSTLLGILAGVIRPGRGSRECPADVRGRIGYVPQETALYESLTGLENLRFWGTACGLPGKIIPIRSRWLLEQLELTEQGDRPVSSYSGGMKRRLHLASALMVTPRLLLLDEPTVGADEHSAQLILSMLTRLRGQDCGIVLISHRAGELERVCDRIVTLDAGRVIREEVGPWQD